MIRWLAIFGVVVAAALPAAEPAAAPFTPAEDIAGSWAFTPNPRLPNVLILGDSISLGYTRDVRARLKDQVNVHRAMRGKAPANCGDTRSGLKNIDAWLGATKWDVIHFNWGLWDLCYRNPQSKTQGNRDKIGGTLSVPLAEYERNLEQLVARLERTGAKLIWATTTTVPEKEAGRVVGDDDRYNAAAARVMRRHGVRIDDLGALTRSFGGKYSKAEGDVHFTPEGYARLAAQVSGAITQALATR